MKMIYDDDFVAPHRHALLTVPRNPNLTFHNGSIRVLAGSRKGSWKGPGGVLEVIDMISKPIRAYIPELCSVQ